eukprot:scaffold14029_cov121-Isochrysis_galbana.AAC.11
MKDDTSRRNGTCACNSFPSTKKATVLRTQSKRRSTWYHRFASYGVAPWVVPPVPSSPMCPSRVNWNCATRLFTSLLSPSIKWPASESSELVRT